MIILRNLIDLLSIAGFQYYNIAGDEIYEIYNEEKNKRLTVLKLDDEWSYRIETNLSSDKEEVGDILELEQLESLQVLKDKIDYFRDL